MKDKTLQVIFRLGYFTRSGFGDALLRQLRKVSAHFKAGWTARKLGYCGKRFFLEPFYTIVGHRYIYIGDNFESRSGLRLEAHDNHNGLIFTPKISIGNNVALNFDCHIACINRVVIGNNVLMASKIFITDHFHGKIDYSAIGVPPNERALYSKGEVHIGDNVWIGEGAVIMPGITIGENSIVGANAVVTKSFGRNSVIGGNPARLLKLLEN